MIGDIRRAIMTDSLRRLGRGHVVQSDERGGIITGWLFQLVLIMAVIGLVAYEAIAIAVTTVNLDDSAREVAQAAQEAYRSRDNLDEASNAAQQAAERLGVGLVSVQVDGDFLDVEVNDQAPTVVTQRIDPLEHFTTPTARRRIRWRP